MNNTAIAFLTKDRVDLSRQSVQPLLRPDKFDLFWIDGSTTRAGESLWAEFSLKPRHVYGNVRGGPDAAIVFALTRMLAAKQYAYVGLVENDVLLDADWFKPTMALFDYELRVGAVSPRAYEDRILIQRDGYGIMHNLGSGCVVFSRKAAEVVLANYRTGFSTDNRAVFNQRSGIDIGTCWAFRGNSQWLTADWHFDTALARMGMASLSLTPAKCGMIGQTPSLEEQGLRLAEREVDVLRSEDAYQRFCDTSLRIKAAPPVHYQHGRWTYFPHQLHQLGAVYAGDWRLKWSQGFGPFAYEASSVGDSLTVRLSGICDILVSGGRLGGAVKVEDPHSGYSCSPILSAEGPQTAVMSLPIPAGVSYRDVEVTALSPGVVFYGVRTSEMQPTVGSGGFGYRTLPPAG